MVRSMALVYRPTLLQVIDNLSAEQINGVVTKAREVLESVECNNYDEELEPHTNE